MATLQEFAKYEIEKSGLLNKDSDYEGFLGKGILSTIKHISKQGHSGGSMSIFKYVLNRLLSYKPINPINKPTKDEYVYHKDCKLCQHKHYSSLFSGDGGKSWYDIDIPTKGKTAEKRFKEMAVTFPYLPK